MLSDNLVKKLVGHELRGVPYDNDMSVPESLNGYH
jgi:hypothetical protein